jgi:protein SCO1/2
LYPSAANHNRYAIIRRVIGGMLRILVISLVVLVAAMMLLKRAGDFAPTVTEATVLDEPRTLPDVALIDQHGEPFAIDDLAGRYVLVFFGFTNCPDICPLTLAVIAEAIRELRADSPELVPEVLFVSIDPARDTPAGIDAYLAAFDPTFIGATADEATIEPLLSALAVTVHKETQGDQTYNVVHNGTIYVLDEASRWAAIFGGSTHRAETIVNDYLAIRSLAPPE